MGISSQWWNHHGILPSDSTALKHDPFDKPALGLRDEIWLAALDALASRVVAMMVLFAIVNVTIFLVFGGLAPRTHVSNDHGWLLTSAG
jgi:hypothetical protein